MSAQYVTLHIKKLDEESQNLSVWLRKLVFLLHVPQVAEAAKAKVCTC
jgi:hypothetical protein